VPPKASQRQGAKSGPLVPALDAREAMLGCLRRVNGPPPQCQASRGLQARRPRDGIVSAARIRAALSRVTCHQLRHTCFTRLREAGRALEAIQAQAGHRSIESTRIYLHLTNGWLASEYARAIDALDDLAPEGQVSR